MLALLRRSPDLTFLLPTFTVQCLLVASQHYQVRNYGLASLRIFFPAIFALMTAAIVYGPERARSHVASLFKYKVHPGFYAFALFYPTVVGFLSIGGLRLLGFDKPFVLELHEVSTLEFFTLSLRVSLAEEIAWVSFMLTLWSTRLGLLGASLVVGFFWGIWYIPLVLANIQVAPGFPIMPLVLNFMCIAAICAWLYQRTKSALVVFIMQFMTNYTGQIVPVLPERGGIPQYVAFVLFKCLFALALFVFWGPKPYFKKPAGHASSLA